MAKKTPIEKLDAAIAKILEEYDANVKADLDIITQRMGQKGAVALRQKSRETFEGTGEYAKGWTYGFRKTSRYAKTTIYNEHYSLPHLLENSHVVRNGTGRVGTYHGRPHIEPIANDLTATYEREVISKL